MASLLTPVAVPGGPSFFQTWALRLPEGVDTGVSSPSVSPSCVDHIARSPVLERSDLKKTYLPSPPDSSKHEVISSHRGLNTSSDDFTEDVDQFISSHNGAESLQQQQTRSRTSSNGSKVLKFFRRSVRSEEAKADQSPPENPSVAAVGQTQKKEHLTLRASLFTSLQSASVDNSVSNPTCEPPSKRTPKVEVEQTAKKKKDRRRRSVFSSFQGATIDKPDPITLVQDGQPPRVTIVKVSPPAETQALEPVASSTNERRHSKGDSRRSSGIEVLYDRSKRFLKGIVRQTSLKPALDHIDPRPTTKVSELLDRVNSVLAHQAYNNTLRSSTPESMTNPQVANARSTPNHKPAHSSSSSIRNLKMGKPPVNTPDSAALYGGPDDREFFKVEISNPDGPTFLPSEARRIGTPPLPSEGPRARRRGFFFDLNAPNAIADSSPSDGDGDEPDTPSTSTKLMTPHARLVAAARRRSAEHNDWFSVQLMVEDAREAEVHFELNVPDHLLGSPLCPRSPMHKFGGKGVCVYHGRNKSFPLE